jgi:hypothetical protein
VLHRSSLSVGLVLVRHLSNGEDYLRCPRVRRKRAIGGLMFLALTPGEGL